MAKHEEYELKTESMVEPILKENGLTLVDVEYVKEAGTWYLRLYIDKEGGVTIDDCELVSRALSDKLDADDFIPDAYTLEVSSPGLGRPLKKEKDYTRNLEKEIEVHLFQAVGKQKEFIGTLKAFDKDTVTMLSDGKEQKLERRNISLIREYVEW